MHSSPTWDQASNTTSCCSTRTISARRNWTRLSQKQKWFRDLKFRQAVSAAIDRDSIVRLVYGTRGSALWGNVGPGNKLWVNRFPASPGALARECAAVTPISRILMEQFESSGGSVGAGGRVLDHHQLFEHATHEDGDLDPGRLGAARHAGTCGPARISGAH